MSVPRSARLRDPSLERADEHVTVVRLNRPDASNALNTQMGKDLVRYFEDVALDPKDLRCIVLTGAGDKAFCAGGDLKERRGMTDEAWTRQHVIFERMVRALIDCPVPIIGAVNGAAYGGGCEIAGCLRFPLRGRHRALCADRSHARHHAGRRRHADPAARRRRAPRQGTDPDRQAVHRERSARLGSRERSISAARSVAGGAGDRIAHRPQCADLGPAGQASIHRGLQSSLRDGLALEIEAYNRMVPTEDRREGVLAFNEKRTPNFKGGETDSVFTRTRH